jgi:Delta24(24(1))-sterol reductase
MSDEKEFGGTRGAIGLILFSHFIPFYFVLSLKYASGGLYWPQSLPDLFVDFQQACSPTWTAVSIYVGFCVIQLIFAAILPGAIVKGLPIPSENNRQYTYNCNALASWYITLICLPLLHVTGVYRLTVLVDEFGSILCVAIICSDIIAVIIHVYAVQTKRTCRTTDSPLYDFFIGVWLNPRISLFGREVDLKLLSEARLSWLLLFLLGMSAAAKQYEQFHTVTWPMIFILSAQLLYVNACMKGEECIVVTWDIFYEKWGWMLIYWNLAGVPFVYAFHAHYILVNSIRTNDPTGGISTGLLIFMFVALCIAYYIWDSSLAQKIHFRMRERGIFIGRNGFPQMPWSALHNPQVIKTKVGDSLLVDGWWKYCRKPQYTTDICMAILWALSCHQWCGLLPYFYPTFFICMILHRYTRDVAKCKAKYGKDWDTYCRRVPYVFIPGVI